jgi:hypothetical protein
MYIAIDSSNQRRVSGVLSGRFVNVIEFYDELERIFKKNSINPPFHWSKISRKVKEKTIDDIAFTFNNSALKFNVINHIKPLYFSKKDFFHIRLPKKIIENLEDWLKYKSGTLCIDVDDDYCINKYMTTEKFLENLIYQIGFRLVGVHIKIRKDGFLKSVIKQENGSILSINGRVYSSKDSRGIQICDILLGIVNLERKIISWRRLYFSKI